MSEPFMSHYGVEDGRDVVWFDWGGKSYFIGFETKAELAECLKRTPLPEYAVLWILSDVERLARDLA